MIVFGGGWGLGLQRRKNSLKKNTSRMYLFIVMAFKYEKAGLDISLNVLLCQHKKNLKPSTLFLMLLLMMMVKNKLLQVLPLWIDFILLQFLSQVFLSRIENGYKTKKIIIFLKNSSFFKPRMPTFHSSLSSSNDNDVIVGVDVDVGASLAIAASHFAALCPVLAGGVKPLASARVGPSGTVRISENSQRNIRLKSICCC